MRGALSLFAGKRVLVTGDTGFKGSWLTLILAELGADVLGLALPPVGPKSHFDELGLSAKVSHINGDIKNFGLVKKAFDSHQPEFVFHLAAQALVGESYLDPLETFSTNFMGSANILEAVRQSNHVRSLIFVTSDKAYENLEWIWGYRENDMLGGRDPYSASKGAAELLFSSYLRSYFLANSKIGAASVRAGNVIGGGDWSEGRIIPDCIRAINGNSDIILRNPGATRPWQHVLEPISGYLLLAARLWSDPNSYSGSWNFGPDSKNVKNVQEVAEFMIGKFGRGRVSLATTEDSNFESKLLQLNCDKAHQELGWFPRWESDVTLEKTADWFRRFESDELVGDLSLSQVREYFGSDWP